MPDQIAVVWKCAVHLHMHCLLHSYSQAALAMSSSACLMVRIKFPFKGSRVLFYDMLGLHGWGVSCLLRSPDLPGSQCFRSDQWPNTLPAPVCPTAAVWHAYREACLSNCILSSFTSARPQVPFTWVPASPLQSTLYTEHLSEVDE